MMHFFKLTNSFMQRSNILFLEENASRFLYT